MLLVSGLLLLAIYLASTSRLVALGVAVGALYLLFDTVVVNTAIVYSTVHGIHPLRSALLTMNAYFNVALSFAPWWLFLDWRDCPPFERAVTAIYQSVRTLATVGPDGTPPLLARILATIELIVGVYFLIVILAIYVSWASGKRSRKRRASDG